ncbi:hypothetical protein VC83_09676 [Pseudogymnoascus destructans]|uniref:Uncharacterized protein n=1 Tax=Pseudogymnoascus destructans TaxID=655981 RepID=A0A2P6FGP3_9PEZI|nr:uncharacterized protein VC83_09676 [Pseudogymnoascus destructans]PQM43549.1 hypothetical protein VC83_09676 [Pseudogymnoascus destructans]
MEVVISGVIHQEEKGEAEYLLGLLTPETTPAPTAFRNRTLEPPQGALEAPTQANQGSSSLDELEESTSPPNHTTSEHATLDGEFATHHPANAHEVQPTTEARSPVEEVEAEEMLSQEVAESSTEQDTCMLQRKASIERKNRFIQHPDRRP